jgi:sterol desaturase/sphingolipid hydroxylase (fatty acid hydroxylase superfamily)
MHIWHHTKDLPTKYSKGCNFGLSLSLWDYLFKTAYVPSDGRDNKLGFFGVESFPRKLWGQLLVGFGGKKKADQ